MGFFRFWFDALWQSLSFSWLIFGVIGTILPAVVSLVQRRWTGAASIPLIKSIADNQAEIQCVIAVLFLVGYLAYAPYKLYREQGEKLAALSGDTTVDESQLSITPVPDPLLIGAPADQEKVPLLARVKNLSHNSKAKVVRVRLLGRLVKAARDAKVLSTWEAQPSEPLLIFELQESALSFTPTRSVEDLRRAGYAEYAVEIEMLDGHKATSAWIVVPPSKPTPMPP